MIKNSHILAKFENEQICKEKLSYRQVLKLLDAFWSEGKTLKVLPPKEPLEGIETKIKIAKIVNQCLKNL